MSGRTQVTPTRSYLADGAHQLRRGGLLECVTVGAAPQGLEHIRVAGMNGQNEHFGVRETVDQLPSQVETASPGHHQIKYDDIGVQAIYQAGQLVAVLGQSHDLEVVFSG